MRLPGKVAAAAAYMRRHWLFGLYVLVAALMIAAFIAYSGDRLWRGAFAVAAGAAVKVFPIGAALFALLRRDRKRALGMVAAAVAVLAVLPVVVVGPHDLLVQYGRWI